MTERYLGRILPGQDMCDVNGDKVGTVAHIYREDVAMMGDAAPDREEVIEVKMGLLGLGQRLYVPVSAVGDATDSAVFVAKAADEFDRSWHDKPEDLDRMT